jgi:predicted  nucleic acid-binding Zn-ribbon protein
MARPAAHSITDVERIAKQLKSQNKQVTPYRVQKALGGGSFAWVKEALEQLGFQDDAGLPTGIDDATARLLRLAQPLVDHLTQQARSDMDTAVEKLQTALTDKNSVLTQQSEKLKENREQLDLEHEAHRNTRLALESAQAKITALEKSHSESETSYQAEKARTRQLEMQLQDRDAQLTALQADRQQQREDFAAQRKALRGEHDAATARLEKLRRESVIDATSQRETVKTLTRDNAALVSERQELQRQCRNFQSELTTLKQKLDNAFENHRVDSVKQAKAQSRLETELENAKALIEQTRLHAERTLEAQQGLQLGLQVHLAHLEHLAPLIPKTQKARTDFNTLFEQAVKLAGKHVE